MDDNKLRYKRIRELLESVKKNWKQSEAEEIYKLYIPLVTRIMKKLNAVHQMPIPLRDRQENCQSFFYELIWEYDLDSPVNFTRYLRRKLYYRLKNYYEKEIDDKKTVYYVENMDGYLSINEIMELVENPKALACINNKTSWSMVANELREKELDLLLCYGLLELRQREISKIFNTFQSGIARIKRRIYKKLADIAVEIA